MERSFARCSITVLVLLMLAMGTITACQGQQTTLTKVVLGYSGSGGGQEILQLARDKGFFSKYGLDVQLYQLEGGSAVQAGLTSGDINYVHSVGTEILNAAVNGAPFKMVAFTINKYVHSYMVRPEIKKPEDLIGKSVAISKPGSGSDFMTRRVFRSLNISVDNVTIMAVGNTPARMAALASGQVYGAPVSPSELMGAEEIGLRTLVDLSDLNIEVPWDAIATTDSFLRNNRETTKNLIKGLVEAIQYYKQNKDDTLAYMAKILNSDVKKAEVGWTKMIKAFADNPLPTITGTQTALDEIAASGMDAAAKAKPEDYIDQSIVQELINDGFIIKK